MDIELGALVGVYSRADTRAVLVVFGARALGVAHETAEASEVRAFAPDELPWDELAFWSTSRRCATRCARVYERAAFAARPLLASIVVIGSPSGVSLLGRLRCIQRDTRAGSVEMMISS